MDYRVDEHAVGSFGLLSPAAELPSWPPDKRRAGGVPLAELMPKLKALKATAQQKERLTDFSLNL